MGMNKKIIILLCLYVGLLSEVSAQGTTNVNTRILRLVILQKTAFGKTISLTTLA